MSAVPAESFSADARARDLARSSFDRPLLLVAGAGTGKTTALVARVAAWCVGPGWERAEARLESGRLRAISELPDRERVAADLLARVVAITFTEAAAAEMSQRIGIVFAQLAAGEHPVGVQASPELEGSVKVRARALLGSLDHLRVSTIHSFCRSLLARHPLEAGLHPRFEIDADERIHSEVIREVLQRALGEADGATSRTPLFELVVEGFGLPAIEDVLLALLREGVSPRLLAADPLPRERVEASLDALMQASTNLWAKVVGPLGDDDIARSSFSLLEALSFTLDAIGPELSADTDALCAFIAELGDAWEGAARKQLVKWSRGDFLVGEVERLGALQPEVAKAAGELLPWLIAFLELQPRRLELARRALTPLLEQCCDALRERGAVGYGALLLGARDLLRDRPELRAAIRGGIDQLLVDEFQDTDRVQCEIIRWLALDGPSDARPGLFLVGDPKQSIYGWRSADLRAYDEFAQGLLDHGGESHLLSVNFRSAPAILDEVERVVEPVMRREIGVQPAFESLTACEARRSDTGFHAEGFAPVEHWVSWEWDAATGAPAEKTRVAEATAIEARALALNIRALHDQQGVAWRDVAMLFRAMSDLDEYLAAFREAGVPYAVERDRSYYRRREIIDAAALVRCVLDPNDLIALVTVLRSPAVGVPDAALIPLWSAELPRRVAVLESCDGAQLTSLAQLLRATAADLATQADELPGIERIAGWEESAIAALENLGALRESFASESADEFVERLRDLALSEVAEASRHLGAFRAANLERFFRELLADLAAGESCEQLLRRLRGDGGSAGEAGQEGPKTHELDAVRVMTIHKAKGLDFEHVYVVQLHKAAGNRGRPAVEVCRDGDHLDYRFFDTATLGFESLRARKAEVEAAERVRTLYVAMTRAKRRVVLAGCWRRSPAPVEAAAATAHVDLLRSRRALPGEDWADEPSPDFAAWMTELEKDGGASLSGAGSRSFGGGSVLGGSTARDEFAARWVFPALIPDLPPSRQTSSVPVELPAEPALREASERLAERKRIAEQRMLRPWRGAASHALERRDRRDEEAFESRPERGNALAPDAASAAGTAVHRLLEQLDLEKELGETLERERKRLPSLLASCCPPASADEALRRADELLERFQNGPLIVRLQELRGAVVARELPVWLAARDPAEGSSSDANATPVGVVSGLIDLVYREPDTGRLVVVDYKTDRVEGEEAIVQRAAGYREQARSYVRALHEALRPELRPRFELWFIHAGRVVPLEL